MNVASVLSNHFRNIWSLWNALPLAIIFFNQALIIFQQMRLMQRIRDSIRDGCFPEFVRKFMDTAYPGGTYPTWVQDSLASVGITLGCGTSQDREPAAPVLSQN
jgi:hypothetical protein